MPITYVTIVCAQCGKQSERYVGHVNRANKDGKRLFCDRTCAGLSRRVEKDKAQKKAEKREYDKAYRYYHKEGIKAKKAAAFKVDYAANPEKYKKERQRRMPSHIERMRQPKWKAYKVDYDRKRRARLQFGEFADAALILLTLESELERKSPELLAIKFQNNTVNKSQKRKRQWKNSQRTT